METQGLIHIYCGDGKGKTTAAIGLGVRAAGWGRRVQMVQFLKSSHTGELFSLSKLPNFQVKRSQQQLGFTFSMGEEERRQARQIQQELLSYAAWAMSHCDLLILDEIMAALSTSMVELPQLLQLIRQKPPHLELVLTGRNPPEELVQLADYVSEICKVKHPFDRGVAARDGVEQ